MRQNGFFAEVIKTSKVDVDDSSHGLPPHNGAYKEFKVADYYCPEEWSNDGIFISVKEGEPLWFDFRSNDECAILCAVQRINPVTGEPADLDEGLAKDPTQNYLRMPEQQWLDGYAKGGKVYQFVVTKAGIGLAVNEFVLPKHMQDSHAIGFAFFGPKNPKPKPMPMPYRGLGTNISVCEYTLPGKYGAKGGGIQSLHSTGHTMGFSPEAGDPDDVFIGNVYSADEICCNDIQEVGGDVTIEGQDPLVIGALGNTMRFTQNRVADDASEAQIAALSSKEVETVNILASQEVNLNELDKASMAAGGRIKQSIVTDENTTDYYHEKRSALLTIYFALPEMYEAIMAKGKRQDASKKDKYTTSGYIGGVAVPLVTQEDH